MFGSIGAAVSSAISAASGISSFGGGGDGKAKISIEGGEPIELQYNPESYSITDKVSTGNSTKENKDPNIQFTEVTRDDFTVELLFDSFETKLDVRSSTSLGKIVKLIQPTQPTQNQAVPKECVFIWAGDVFKGLVTSIKQNFTLFDSKGIPLRAKLSLTFQYKNSTKETEEKKGKNQCRKVRTVQEGERLDLIAHRSLHNPYLWRELVKENPEIITNPRTYPNEEHVGKNLVIPDYYDAMGEKNA